MIRATITAAVDQALLSALNFGLAVLLIHYASKQEYGLYSQLMNLQSFFSPFHAGVFTSAYLALSAKMDEPRQLSYRTAMARAEVAISAVSAVLVSVTFLVASHLFWPAITPNMSLAFGAALIALWWREFVRQTRFAVLRYDLALKVDVMYAVATTIAGGTLVVIGNISASGIFWCMGLGGIAAAIRPLVAAIRGSSVPLQAIKRDVLLSWSMGRWEVLTSVVSWTTSQSYVYFAALAGGLDAAAEIAAGRLLATPLSLMWTSYANVLRPSASRLLNTESNLEIRRLAARSALFVAVASLLYALIVYAAIPLLDRSFFGGKFEHLRSLAMWWIVYFMLTGITTVASSVLRSALEFRQVFHRQALTCAAAVVLLTIGWRLQAIESLVIALVAVEAISASLFWHRLNTAVSLRPKAV